MLGFLETIDMTSPTAGVNPAARVGATEAALDLLDMLRARHGAVCIHHAGGCTDGVEPVCLAQGVLQLGEDDRLLGEIDGVPVHVSGPRSESWDDHQFVLDVVKGQSAGFSLVGGMGLRFIARPRRFEAADRAMLGLPPG
jgi:uncharacterized protein (DUF779 family)